MSEFTTDLWKKVFKKKGDIVSREVAGETILVPIRGNFTDMQKIWSLNPAAGHIWQSLDGKKSVEDIRNEILATYDVEKKDADLDIQEFISDLLKAELIEENQGGVNLREGRVKKNQEMS